MDIISYNIGATANGRIESFIENPDSASGVLTVPKVIAAGETITIPAGRVAVLPNVQVDGTLNISGEVFIPSGATTTDLDNRIALKADTTYVDTQIATRTRLVQGTAVNSTSGTSIDFIGIPSWAKKITVMFNGVSTNGESLVQVQLGSTTIQITRYVGSTTLVYGSNQTVVSSSTTGIPLCFASSAAARTGILSILNFLNNTWIASGVLGSGATSATSAGSVTLSGTLDRIRITTVNGTDTFDAGQINIMYEG